MSSAARRGAPALAAVAALLLATAFVAILESALSVENGSPLYLVAVTAVALRFGTWPAVATATGGFLLYNLLFVDPRFTLAVARPQELLTLVLLLFVGIVIGRLAGRQREREQAALRREQEARALFGISRELVRSERLPEALEAVGERLAVATNMARVWIGVGATTALERTLADTRPVEPIPATDGSHFVLRRDASEEAASWVHIHPPGARRPKESGSRLYRIELRAGEDIVGSLWAARHGASAPALEETRLLAAAADQVGGAIRRNRLLTQSAELEIARRSDELKSALVDSVSHDLRTPLSAIRAAAGSLADPVITLGDDERRSIALGIDAEAERLSRLVGDLLDMSRIRGGALVPQLEIFPLEELVLPAVERAALVGDRSPMELDLPDDLPPVRVDGALLDRVIANLLDNATRHTPRDARIRVAAMPGADGTVVITVEDGGPGVPDEALGSIFERFSGADRRPTGGRSGVGLGLAVARGLAEAMGGTVAATRSELGGLAVSVTVPSEPGAAPKT